MICLMCRQDHDAELEEIERAIEYLVEKARRLNNPLYEED